VLKIKKAIKVFFILGAVIISIHAIHALTLDRTIEYKEVSLNSSRWPEKLDGYLIAFITDIHTAPDEVLQSIVNELNERQIDLLLLGGDFSMKDGHYIRSIEILSEIKTTDGIFGVEGNHDDYMRLFNVMEAYNITPLSNSGLHIHNGFFLAGTEDLWNRNPCIATATLNAEPGDFILLVSHNPDIAMKQTTGGLDLILSGHTHGGQITFFGLWAPWLTLRSSITEYGQRFSSGWSLSRDGVSVYVSNGTGEYFHIPRVFARPQVILMSIETVK